MRALLFVTALLSSSAPAEPQPWEEWKHHAPPKRLAEGAMSEDWPRFLGPSDAPVSKETGIEKTFPAAGPAKVWECTKGEGYASPAMVDGRLFLFHRTGGQERLDCLDALTGKRHWSHAYDVDYRDDFGYSAGPRCGPVVSGKRVVTFGVTSWLKCYDAESGKVLWSHDAQEAYGVPKYFFGSGASPLIFRNLVIVNLGGSENRCVCAFDLETGALKWTALHEWGQSYASPIMARINGRDRVLVFAGGKSQPSTGGLLSIDPADGRIEDAFFWRAKRFPSVNAQTPVLCGPNRVFISQAYVDRGSECNGGVMLEAGEDGKFKAAWKAPDVGCHWNTPVFHDGHLYAFSGEKDRACQLVCVDAATGKQKWAEQFSRTVTVDGQEVSAGLFRGSLLHVGGHFLALGEWGTLMWLDLSPAGAKKLSEFQPFLAEESWTLPALSHGLLYVSRNQADKLNGAPPALLCYDLRASSSK
jgi:outer membrane protein assembly factor BamB